MNTFYSYKDIVLQPAYSEIQSRSSLDVSVKFLGKTFESAAIPANMKCTINFKKARELSEAGYFYVLHRFYDYEDILGWMVENKDIKTISISVGVNRKDRDFIDKIVKQNIRVDFITIDVAHGHHVLVKEMITYIKTYTIGELMQLKLDCQWVRAVLRITVQVLVHRCLLQSHLLLERNLVSM